MFGGYVGKMLFVDLSNGEIKEEILEEKMCRDYIGCYGIGARILYTRQKAGVDPLGPENTLGLITGPLTGTLAATGLRYMAVAKFPLNRRRLGRSQLRRLFWALPQVCGL